MAAAQQAERRRTAERLGGEAIVEGIDVVDRLAIDRNDDVAGLEAGMLGRAAARDAGDQRAGRALEAHAVGDVGGDLLQLGTEPGPLHRAAAAFGGGHHHPHHVGGNGEADALRAARAREDGGVDADQPAGEVDQRAAGIARIDGGVGLDEELVVGDADLRARQRRDDAVRHGLPDAEGIADGEHHVADFERVGIGEFQHRKALMRILDAQHGEIAALVLEHDLGLELALVGERHLDLVGALDHVHVGDDKAARIDDHAGAERALDLAAAAVARHAEEAAEDRVVEQRVAVLDDLGGIDIDHRRCHPLHHRRIGQPQFGGVRHPALLSGSDGYAGQGDGGKQGGSQGSFQAHVGDSRRDAEI